MRTDGTTTSSGPDRGPAGPQALCDPAIVRGDTVGTDELVEHEPVLDALEHHESLGRR